MQNNKKENIMPTYSSNKANILFLDFRDEVSVGQSRFRTLEKKYEF